MSDFYFNGHAASEMGLTIEKYPTRVGGKKRIETVSIPGRFGNLTLRQKRQTYDNCIMRYECYYHADGIASEQANNVFTWLNRPEGFVELRDTYDPTVYRMARYAGESSAEIFGNNFGRIAIDFECDARAWLLSGGDPITYHGQAALVNNYLESYPLIVIEKSHDVSSAGTVTIGGQTITILAGPVYTIHIDSETMEVPSLDSLYVNFDEYPVLKPGNNAITMTGDITGVTITPRWYKV